MNRFLFVSLVSVAAGCAAPPAETSTDAVPGGFSDTGVARQPMPIGVPFAADTTILPVPYRGTQTVMAPLGTGQMVLSVQSSDADFNAAYVRRLTRVDAAGVTLDPQGIVTDVGMFAALLAGNASGGLVVGHDAADYHDAVARRIGLDGVFLDPAPFSLLPDAYAYAVAASPSGYLVGLDDDDDLLLLRVGLDGVVQGAPILVASENNLGSVALAYANGAYVVAWSDNDVIKVTFVDEAGALLQPAPTVIAMNDPGLIGAAANATGFVVGYETGGAFSFARFSPARVLGTFVGVPLGAFDYGFQLAAGPTGFLAGWRGQNALQMGAFSIDGAVTPVVPPNPEAYPYTLSGDATGYLMVDEQYLPDDLSTSVFRLDPQGATVTAPLPLGVDGDRQGEPLVVATSNRVLVSWIRDGEDGNEVRGRMFDHDGVDQGDTARLGPGSGVLAYAGDRGLFHAAAAVTTFLAAGPHPTGGTWLGAFDSQGAPLVASTDVHAPVSGIAWDGTQFVVLFGDGTWARFASDGTATHPAAPLLPSLPYATALDCDGTRCVLASIDGGSVEAHVFDSATGVAVAPIQVGDVNACTLCDPELDVAVRGGRAIVAWDSGLANPGSTVTSSIVDLDAVTSTAPVEVAANGFGVKVATIGAGFVVAYADPRSTGSNDIHVRRATVSGALLPAELLVDDMRIDSSLSVTATSGDQLILAYEKIDPTTFKERVFLQRFDATFGGGALGEPCGNGAACASGFCFDGVCCDTSCEGACAACSVAAGATTDGTCAALPATTTCRAAGGTCDAAETCDGVAHDCPADASVPDLTPCDDGNACTTGDRCSSGLCSWESELTCPLPTECQLASTCTPAVGCVFTPAADGTPCSAGVCLGGACTDVPTTATQGASTSGAQSTTTGGDDGAGGEGAGGGDGDGPDDDGCGCRVGVAHETSRWAWLGVACIVARIVRRRRAIV